MTEIDGGEGIEELWEENSSANQSEMGPKDQKDCFGLILRITMLIFERYHWSFQETFDGPSRNILTRKHIQEAKEKCNPTFSNPPKKESQTNQ